MKSACLIGLVASLLLLLNLPTPSMQKDDSLLEQSFNLSQGLDADKQVLYLTELCRVNIQLRSPQADNPCMTLFNAALAEKDPRISVPGQKNALMYLSALDPTRAMDLLSQVRFERPAAGYWVNEDPRYNAAAAAFVNLLAESKPQSVSFRENISKIRETAISLGKTGQYPYHGIADVITQHGILTDEANALLNDALGFYEWETGFRNRDEEFLILLRSLKNSPVNEKLAAKACSMCADHLKKDPIQFPGNYYAEIQTVSNGDIFPFTDRNQAFLFQAFPTIKRFNPKRAKELLQDDEKLDRAADKMRYISGGFVQADPTSEEAVQQHREWLDESLIKRIKECQDSNPQAATRLAQRLSNSSSRIVGFSAAIPALAQTNSGAARGIYKDQLLELNNLDDSLGKLKAMVALVRAAHYLDNSDYKNLAEQTFTSGVQRIKGSNSKSDSSSEGFEQLRDLVIFAASQPGDILKPKVQELPSGWLKTYLLLYEEEGQSNLNVHPAPTTCPE